MELGCYRCQFWLDGGGSTGGQGTIPRCWGDRSSPATVSHADSRDRFRQRQAAFINETLFPIASSKRLSSLAHERTTRTIKPGLNRKNSAVIRRFIGYQRFSGIVAGQALPLLLPSHALYVNFFQPSFKLRSKRREGAKVKKCYFKPATPAARLLEHAAVLEATKRAASQPMFLT